MPARRLYSRGAEPCLRPLPVDPADARELVLGYGSRRTAEACGVSLKQVRRWMDGSCRMPRAAYRLLRILGERDLGEIDPTWRGWRLWADYLHTPEGTPIRRTWFHEMMYLLGARDIREEGLRAQIRRLGKLLGAVLQSAKRHRRPMQLSMTFQAPTTISTILEGKTPSLRPGISRPQTAARCDIHDSSIAITAFRRGADQSRSAAQPLL